jgi:hypothetical protein
MIVEERTELERIRHLADYLVDPQDMLAGILRRIEESYFYRNSRLSAAELLTPDLKDKAMLLHRVIGESSLHDCLKQRICGSVEFFLRGTCNVGPAEMAKFKAGSVFDPVTFNLFQGLED